MFAMIRTVGAIVRREGRGAIGHVRTGEGKSYITTVCAIALVQRRRKVDIITSNSALAIRDQREQAATLNLFQIESGVVLGPAKDGGWDRKVLALPIIYSTGYALQCIYIRSQFTLKPERNDAIRPYDVAIVDEVDNMFLDRLSCPTQLEMKFPILNFEEICRFVFERARANPDEVVQQLSDANLIYRQSGNERAKVEELQRSAQQAVVDMHKDRHYAIVDKKIIPLDRATSFPQWNSHFSNGLHEMLEVKHGLKLSSPGIANVMVTQQCYFNLYAGLAGLTGTIGSDDDLQVLMSTYGVSIFKIPRYVPCRQVVNYVERRREFLNDVEREVRDVSGRGRPVLVIFEHKGEAEDFAPRFPGARLVLGMDLSGDADAIEIAGMAGVITIATNTAGRGTDIMLWGDALMHGGLHVIIPHPPTNQRTLEQAMGRSARQGQRGSVTIYHRVDDFFVGLPPHHKGDLALFRMQERLSRDLLRTRPWLFDVRVGLKVDFPFAASPIDVLRAYAREICFVCRECRTLIESGIQLFVCGVDQRGRMRELSKQIGGMVLDMILAAWGLVYEVAQKTFRDEPGLCESAYSDFMTNLIDVWIPEGIQNGIDALVLFYALGLAEPSGEDLLGLALGNPPGVLRSIQKIATERVFTWAESGLSVDVIVEGSFEVDSRDVKKRRDLILAGNWESDKGNLRFNPSRVDILQELWGIRFKAEIDLRKGGIGAFIDFGPGSVGIRQGPGSIEGEINIGAHTLAIKIASAVLPTIEVTVELTMSWKGELVGAEGGKQKGKTVVILKWRPIEFQAALGLNLFELGQILLTGFGQLLKAVSTALEWLLTNGGAIVAVAILSLGIAYLRAQGLDWLAEALQRVV
jgi:hypothetical protein